MPDWYVIPIDWDQVGTHLSSINTTLDPMNFSQSLSNRADQSKFGVSVGSTTTRIGLTDVGALFEDPTIVEVSAVHEELPKGVNPVDLAMVWQINAETARHTLDITTQLKQQDTDGNLAHNFSMNDRMLRYRQINSHLFTDTLFVTKRAKSTRGNTCMQLFLWDKGFFCRANEVKRGVPVGPQIVC